MGWGVRALNTDVELRGVRLPDLEECVHRSEDDISYILKNLVAIAAYSPGSLEELDEIRNRMENLVSDIEALVARRTKAQIILDADNKEEF